MSEREASARWRAKNPEYAREYYLKHKDTIDARQRARLARDGGKHKELMKAWNQRHREKLLAGRSTHCPICAKPLVKPYADHCHKTAERLCEHVPYKACLRCRRDVICPTCNWLLGLAKDDTKILKRAAQYLARWNRTLRRRK